MPTAAQIKHFLIGTILPIGVGVATAWIVGSVHVLNTFGITERQVGGELTLFGTWAVSTTLTWLKVHHILKGTYSPAALGRPILGEVFSTRTAAARIEGGPPKGSA